MKSILSQILSRIYESGPFRNLLKETLAHKDIHISGITGSLEAVLLYLLREEAGRTFLVVLPDEDQAEALADEINSVSGLEHAFFFPGGQDYKDAPLILNPRKAGMQSRALSSLSSGKAAFIVTDASGFIQKVPEPDAFADKMASLSPGLNISMESLIKKLFNFGYTREAVTERPGEISLRGGILDIFPFSSSVPYRAEFFGNTIDSLRIFNPATQRSVRRAESLTLLPSIQTWEESLSTLAAWMPEGSILFFRDRDTVMANAEKIFITNSEVFEDPVTVQKTSSSFTQILSSSLSGSSPVINFKSRSVSIPETSPKLIRKILAEASEHSTVFISCRDEKEKGRIQAFLNLNEDPADNFVIGISPLNSGFDLTGQNLTVITGRDIFGRSRLKRKRAEFTSGSPIRELSSLKRGDFVVHIDHGIGRYIKLDKINVGGTEQECLSIEYQGGDILYVPLDSMERIQKYSGREGASVQISKLGTGAWEKLKARTKDSVKKIAKELISLYSERHHKPGFAFSPDTPWQKNLEANFVYEETFDQAKAIEEVKTDMESSRPMDRLICGDVGFGKTEVALRASFKAVNDSKQVAVLVPTTILAQQHFNTFRQRLSGFPVTIEMLSRFRSGKEQSKIIDGLKTGEIDIVIGTHRLFSKDIIFKDLGLLIIDEEQRFGVRQKEKLKALKKSVDVLSMSATPIPRTLQFSLAGIRDMSLINTPPRDRLPIHTEVVPFRENVIAEAIERELERGGQVFFVHNRVKSIHAVADMVKRLVPSVRLAVAHGQMDGRDLERVMFDFGNGKYDCLISTMIIESGLDMPSVNTLIVHRADQLGLSQLYQIRGRVGRSGNRAYAYLLTPPFHLLSQEAVKRLRTIEEFTELGAGFQIARRDLEIRGAGNFFGLEQSGIMDAVGAELYTKLIEEAVKEIKSESDNIEQAPPEISCSVSSHLSAFLPDLYVKDENLKLDIYRRLSLARGLKQITNIEDELKDRFGPLPKEADTLLESARISILGRERGFKRISIAEAEVRLFLDESWPERFETPELFSMYLRSFTTGSEHNVHFLKGDKFGIKISTGKHNPFDITKKLLQS
ncbi:transcription-repair coupling factor [bacterium]|nr:transcription-repair coupling factor [bacterium]